MKKLHYDGIIIRHEPDGELIAVFTSPKFNQDDVTEAVRKIISFSNNFSIRGFHTSESHIDYDNNIKIRRELTKEG